jgi:hypothetical protein
MKRIIFITLIILVFGSFNAFAEREKYKIEVYFDTCEVIIYNSSGKVVHECLATLTWKKIKLPQKGIIKKEDIILGPSWIPTEGVKERYYQKHGVRLLNYYPPGHKKNAMGAFKWVPTFIVSEGYYPGDTDIRFHEEKDPENLGKYLSSGCIRLPKKSGIPLSYKFLEAEKIEFELTTLAIKSWQAGIPIFRAEK